MMRLTDVVKNLLIINVIMYFGTLFILGEPYQALELINNPNPESFNQWGRNILALFFPNSVYFQPYQVVTHMFMHGSTMHLFFNMFALYMFGPPLENYFGPKKFLAYYLLTGFGALILQLFVTYLSMTYFGASPYTANVPMLGASGAVFGLLAGFGTLFPETKLMLLFPPIPIKAKWFVLMYGAIELFLGLGSFNTGVAHFAHLGGAIFGFLLIQYWRKNGNLFNR